jgi:hypothetical protein
VKVKLKVKNLKGPATAFDFPLLPSLTGGGGTEDRKARDALQSMRDTHTHPPSCLSLSIFCI